MSVETIGRTVPALTLVQQRKAEQLAAYVHRSLPGGRRFFMAGLGPECLKEQLSPKNPNPQDIRETLIAACMMTGAGVRFEVPGCKRIFSAKELL